MAFFVSAAPQPHPDRTRAILERYPEVRSLFGRNRWTALIAVLVVMIQASIAAALGRLGIAWWPAAVITAYAAGAFANHALYVVIHDATHRLVFSSRSANRLLAVFSDLPNVLPGAIGFGICHLKHHTHQGVYSLDPDIASDWEARLIGHSWYGKLCWQILFPLFQLARPARMKGFSVFSGWTFLNVIACGAFDWFMVSAFGLNALLYLVLSWVFSIGPHPVGGRWIQEHFTLDPGQETRSYYGGLNRLALNVGYHNEHHDFPAVPWNRLPRLHAMAAEFYDSQDPVYSWTRTWLRFLFDRRYSLYSRVLRTSAPAGA